MQTHDKSDDATEQEAELAALRKVAYAALRWRKAIEANAMSWSLEGMRHVQAEGRAIYYALDMAQRFLS